MGILSAVIGVAKKVGGKVLGMGKTVAGAVGPTALTLGGVAAASGVAGAIAAPGPLFGAKKKKRRRRSRLTMSEIRELITLKAVIGEKAFQHGPAGQIAVIQALGRGR